MTTVFEHAPHPHTLRRLSGQAPGPATVDQGRVGVNGRIGLAITTAVGTMVCAYLFGLVALISLPSALASGNLTVIIAWLSSNFLQLVLLPVIIVGQNLQARAADRRSEQTYRDAEALLHEAMQIQRHLDAQDAALAALTAGAGK